VVFQSIILGEIEKFIHIFLYGLDLFMVLLLSLFEFAFHAFLNGLVMLVLFLLQFGDIFPHLVEYQKDLFELAFTFSIVDLPFDFVVAWFVVILHVG
jgi:hypothetical protein